MLSGWKRNKANRSRRSGKKRRMWRRPARRGGSDPGFQSENAERFPHPDDGAQAMKEAAEHVERLEDEP